LKEKKKIKEQEEANSGQLNMADLRADEMEEARNKILHAFKEFYMVQKPPQQNTLEALNYKPWKPDKSLLQYSQCSIQDFKPLIGIINTPHIQFAFSTFGDAVVSQLLLLVPVVKLIRLETSRYHAFTSFPNEVKNFVNGVLRFLTTMKNLKGKYQNNANLNPADPVVIQFNTSKQELTLYLRAVLNTLRQIIVAESRIAQQISARTT